MDTTVATKVDSTNRPVWGAWVSHYDSAGQMSTVDPWLAEDNTIVSLVFDKMSISLQGDDQNKLAGSIGLAGHYQIALPDEFDLRGFILAAHGFVWKTPETSVILTLSIGESAKVFEWPKHDRIIDVSDPPQPVNNDREFNFWAECFVGDGHPAVGYPPTFPPIAPLNLSIGMQARRRSVKEDLHVSLDGVEIIMVDLKAPPQTDRGRHMSARSAPPRKRPMKSAA